MYFINLTRCKKLKQSCKHHFILCSRAEYLVQTKYAAAQYCSINYFYFVLNVCFHNMTFSRANKHQTCSTLTAMVWKLLQLLK